MRFLAAIGTLLGLVLLVAPGCAVTSRADTHRTDDAPARTEAIPEYDPEVAAVSPEHRSDPHLEHDADHWPPEHPTFYRRWVRPPVVGATTVFLDTLIVTTGVGLIVGGFAGELLVCGCTQGELARAGLYLGIGTIAHTLTWEDANGIVP